MQKQLGTAILRTIGLEAVWGAVQIAIGFFLIDRELIRDWLLDSDYRRLDQPGLTDDIAAALITAAAIVFGVGLLASLLWVVVTGRFFRIYVPGQAAQLFALWLAILAIGAGFCAAAAYFLLDNTRLVPFDGKIAVAAAAAVDFVISYYLVGTWWPTVPKVRTAVPWSRVFSA